MSQPKLHSVLMYTSALSAWMALGSTGSPVVDGPGSSMTTAERSDARVRRGLKSGLLSTALPPTPWRLGRSRRSRPAFALGRAARQARVDSASRGKHERCGRSHSSFRGPRAGERFGDAPGVSQRPRRTIPLPRSGSSGPVQSRDRPPPIRPAALARCQSADAGSAAEVSRPFRGSLVRPAFGD